MRHNLLAVYKCHVNRQAHFKAARPLIDKRITGCATFDAVAFYLSILLRPRRNFYVQINKYILFLKFIYNIHWNVPIIISFFLFACTFWTWERVREETELVCRRRRAANEASIYGCKPNGLYVTRVGLGKCRKHTAVSPSHCCCIGNHFLKHGLKSISIFVLSVVDYKWNLRGNFKLIRISNLYYELNSQQSQSQYMYISKQLLIIRAITYLLKNCHSIQSLDYFWG